MSEDVEVNYLLTVNVEDASTQIRQYERLLFRTLSLLRRMGLPEDVAAIISQIQRLISLFRMLRLTATLAQTAMGPVGWAMVGVTAVTTAYEVGEEVEARGLYLPQPSGAYEWARGKP